MDFECLSQEMLIGRLLQDLHDTGMFKSLFQDYRLFLLQEELRTCYFIYLFF